MSPMNRGLPDYTGQSILVTGGAGFIGSHLVDGLFMAGADKVVVVDNFFLGKDENLFDARINYGDRLSIYRENAGDFYTMRAIVSEQKPNMVFNLATKALLYSFFSPAEAYRVNTEIAICLGELLREGQYGRLVHFSTSEVYGSGQTFPMSEDHPLLAETSYAAGKAAADLLLASYVNMFDIDVVTVRPFNNFGPRQNEGHLAAIVPLTLKRIRAGEPPIIMGDGKQTRDFIYVGDTILAALKIGLLPNARGETFNVGSGKETTILEVIETLIDLTNFEGVPTYEPARKADVRRHVADVSRIESLIGTLTVTSLVEGLSEVVASHPGA